MKKLTALVLVVVIIIIAMAFGKKQSKFEVVPLESQYAVTLWLNENNPSEVVDIATTGTLWWVFYKK